MGVDWKGQSHEEKESVTLWGKEIFKSNTEDMLPRHQGEQKSSLENHFNINRKNEGKEGRWKNREKAM